MLGEWKRKNEEGGKGTREKENEKKEGRRGQEGGYSLKEDPEIYIL